MNINIFFVAIMAVLGMIYLFFEPMKLAELNHKETPQLELTKFSVYELNEKGVKSVFYGNRGFRFADEQTDRYEVYDINYTDYVRENIAHIASDYGTYRNHLVTLDGNVSYARSDGMTFKSDKATYDQDKAVFRTPGNYTFSRNDDKITGTKLFFDSNATHVTSQKISATYQIKN
jgi:LPS export ABC transporter protein LptC